MTCQPHFSGHRSQVLKQVDVFKKIPLDSENPDFHHAFNRLLTVLPLSDIRKYLDIGFPNSIGFGLPTAVSYLFDLRHGGYISSNHRLTQVLADLGQDLRIFKVGHRFNNGCSALGWFTGLENT